MAAAPVTPVEAQRVAEVGAADASRQRRGRIGDCEMQMIGHQAVAEDAELLAAAELAEGGEVEAAVVVEQEDVLAVVAALGDGMRAAGEDDAWLARHAGIVAASRAQVKRNARLSLVLPSARRPDQLSSSRPFSSAWVCAERSSLPIMDVTGLSLLSRSLAVLPYVLTFTPRLSRKLESNARSTCERSTVSCLSARNCREIKLSILRASMMSA